MTTLPNRRPLVRVFCWDAWLAAGLALALIALADFFYRWSNGGYDATTLRAIGVALVPWAYHNWTIGHAASWRPVAMVLQILGDVTWLLGSAFVCMRDGAEWTAFGYVLYGPQMLVVACILALKIRALLASFRGATDGPEQHANTSPSH